MTTIVTTSQDLTDTSEAQQLARENAWEYIARSELPGLNTLTSKIIVMEKHKVSLRFQDHVLFFHPGLALLRIQNILRGEGDRFAQSCRLSAGQTFLDCTLGLAADALVAAFCVGSAGKVVGLEAIQEVAVITKLGLRDFTTESLQITAAARNIEIHNISAEAYLPTLQDNAFDCVYFDPMFKRPNLQSSAMNMLRPFAYHKELSKQDIALALTKAKNCVVVKERSLKKIQELQPHEILGGKNAKIFYARWNK